MYRRKSSVSRTQADKRNLRAPKSTGSDLAAASGNFTFCGLILLKKLFFCKS
jgi:hypothetical protein